MERPDLGSSISKKRRIDSTISAEIPNLKGEGFSEVVESISMSRKIVDGIVYRLYFKGLVSDETTTNNSKMVKAGLGVAICDEADNLVHEKKESVTTTKNINKINGRVENLSETMVYLLDELNSLREKLVSSEIVLVSQNDVKFAYTLARDAIVSQSSIGVDVMEAEPQGQGETCVVCHDDTDRRFFTNDACLHRHCFTCVSILVEVELLEGDLPTCLEHGCKSQISPESCIQVVRPNLIGMWKRRIEEESIPAAERIYCPYPRCSMLMSRTELFIEGDQSNVVRACVKCRGLFCVECKLLMT
ncbi:uncharacterized protein LOC17890169 [Capsella rubella]|uniref:uncharacterized protein LOC17890169 n=1 Tax=Capsella rubella TaxID=81985 RepID=UPI000CD52CFD|nr:uncharacterized protein LOC17890169 [Capsella rubella]